MEVGLELSKFIQAHLGPEARLASFGEADGHAGLTYLFDAERPDHGCSRYVLKLAPKGVRRSGNTDVYRQARLLRTLHAHGLPVPAVPWAEEGERWFGVPFIVMERLPGCTFQYWDPHPSLPRTAAFALSAWRQAVDTLPDFHKFDWRRHLADWEEPEDLRQQVERWRSVYAKAPEPRWIEMAEQTEWLLLSHLPTKDNNPIGLVHGDYQPGNLLFHDGRVSGVIDWELSGIGGSLLDVGWLMMMSDRTGWSLLSDPMPALDPALIQDMYEARMERAFRALSWFRAYAGFRMGSIACLNVRLHRKGQRNDPIWESLALGIPEFFGNARALLEGRR